MIWKLSLPIHLHQYCHTYRKLLSMYCEKWKNLKLFVKYFKRFQTDRCIFSCIYNRILKIHFRNMCMLIDKIEFNSKFVVLVCMWLVDTKNCMLRRSRNLSKVILVELTNRGIRVWKFINRGRRCILKWTSNNSIIDLIKFFNWRTIQTRRTLWKYRVSCFIFVYIIFIIIDVWK